MLIIRNLRKKREKEKKMIKTYNITYRESEADDRELVLKRLPIKQTQLKKQKNFFMLNIPKQRERTYIEIHSPLSNYQIDRDNQKIAEIPKDTNMKKINILNIFKTVNEYVQQITMLIIGLIPLLLLGVVIFGDDFFLWQ